MKVNYRLSTKHNGKYSEILLSIFPYICGKVQTMRAKSGIFVSEKYFDKASGVMSLTRKYNPTPEVIYHKEQAEALHRLVSHIEDRYFHTNVSTMSASWLKDLVYEYYHPEKSDANEKKPFYELAEDYISKKMVGEGYARGFRVVVRAVLRYEGFVRETQKGMSAFVFDIDTVTRDDIEDFRDYLRNEKALSEEYPTLYKRLFNEYPVGLTTYNKVVEDRGQNTIISKIKKLKSFFVWLYETGRTKNRPFDGIKIGTIQAGTPIYINIDERNIIATTPMPSKHLEAQRDIFIFQCLIGCRVGDLMKMTEKNITGRMLTYTPHKTKNEGEQAFTARVPLIDEAVVLMEKYKGIDKHGRLFPFITPQKYNDAIKEIFSLAGITRNVEVRNALTEEIEIRPINEVASSHMARRTFIGNLYFKVQDPNLIGQMSGHVEGSRAFQRYRRIEDETLMNVVEFLR